MRRPLIQLVLAAIAGALSGVHLAQRAPPAVECPVCPVCPVVVPATPAPEEVPDGPIQI